MFKLAIEQNKCFQAMVALIVGFGCHHMSIKVINLMKLKINVRNGWLCEELLGF